MDKNNKLYPDEVASDTKMSGDNHILQYILADSPDGTESRV